MAGNTTNISIRMDSDLKAWERQNILYVLVLTLSRTGSHSDLLDR